MPLRRIRDLAFVEGAVIREELPKDSTVEYIDLLVTGDIGGAGAGVPLNAARLLARCELQANGKPLYDMQGIELYRLNSALQGENIEQEIADPAGGVVPLFFLLRFWLTDPKGRNPQRADLNLRRLEQLSLAVTVGTVANIFTGGVQTLANLRARIFYGETLGRGGDAVVVNRAFEYVLTGARQIIEWKERGAVLKAMLVTLRNAGGVEVDNGLNVFGLRVDGKTSLIDELPFEYIRALTTFATGLDAAEIDAGVGYWDFDPDKRGRGLPTLDGVNTELELEGTVAFTVRIIRRQYVPLEAYLSVGR
jgi:hypothetical protein